jgi:GGDEF domain-containing protein
MVHIYKNKKIYEKDILIFDANKENDDEYIKSMVNIIKKDIKTGAYNKPFIEDILTHEIARTHRYKTELSILSIQINLKDEYDGELKQIGKVISDKSRENDYFGKTDDSRYIVLASNTSISGAVILAQKLMAELDKFENAQIYFGLTQVSDTDTFESIHEKLEDALYKAINGNDQKIEIEV